MNAREQLTGATYGSDLLATYGFDAHGYPNASSAGSVQDYRYVFDPVTGNLSSRQNYKRGLSESFSYTGNGDNLDRLTGVTGPQNLNMTYDANGNIKTKSDISNTVNFGYGTNAGPYALTEVSSSTGVIPTNPQAVTYTSFENVATIAEGNYNASIIYNSENQRAKMDVTQSGSNILTRWYAGNSYMKETTGGVTREYTYLGGDAYTAPVAAVTQDGATAYYYLLRDYLGNITHQVNTSNEVVAEYNFDAWGRRRSADDWSYTLDGNDLALFADRGFTGHEHLTWFNLVNMNGRLYDPLVGRFLNVDPYVQMPDYTQNFNRYSYCLNNPLKFTDPNGEWFGIDDGIAFVIGGAVNLTVNLIQGNIDNIGEGLAAFGAGGAAGTLSLYGPAGWAAGGAIVGGTNAWVGGAKGWDILKGVGVGGLSGLAGGAVGQWAAQGLGNVVVQGLNITSPVIKGVVGGTIGGAAGGYVGGFTGGILTTGNLKAAHQAGISGMITGAPIGGVAGGIGAYAYAKANDINPWTGKYNKSVVIGRQMESRVNPAAGDLGAETITNAWNEQFGEGVRVSDSKGIQFNRRWYSSKLNDGYHVYDIGSGGLPTGKYYGAELSLSKGYWNISKTNYWSFFNNNMRIIYYGK
jgi:RHS repeat-associated protein